MTGMRRQRDLMIVLAVVIPLGVVFALLLGFISKSWPGSVAGVIGALVGVTAVLIWKYRTRPPAS